MSFDARTAKLLAAGKHLIIPECPGLRLQASASRRTWIYRFKSPIDARMRQFKIGEWPATSFPAAVAAWERLRGARGSGIDLVAERRSARMRSRSTSTGDDRREPLDGLTVRELCENYLTGHVERHRKHIGAAEVRRMFDKMLGEFGRLPADQITRSQAFDLLEQFSKTPVLAAKLRAELGGAWDYALDAGRLAESAPNWWRLIMKGRLRSRGRKIQGKSIGVIKRVLNSDEIGILLRWLPNFSPLVNDALTLYLWTCARGSEILGMEVSEITEETDGLWWTVPKEKTKNARHPTATDQRVPLIGRAESVVRRRLLTRGEGGYLFPSRGLSGHVERKRIGAAVWSYMPYSKSRPPHQAPLPVVRWSPHDLRRSSRTLLASMGCTDEVAEAILGHMKPGITGVYNRHTYDAERREWLSKLSLRLESLAIAGA